MFKRSARSNLDAFAGQSHLRQVQIGGPQFLRLAAVLVFGTSIAAMLASCIVRAVVPGTPTPRGTLPAPTGPYQVGRTTFDWIDEARADPYALDEGEKREVVVWVWYPAAPGPATPRAEYMPPGYEAVGQFWGFDAANVQDHAFADAPVANNQATYPVLIFTNNGFPPHVYSSILEELASQGYIVVGINNTYQTPVTVLAGGRVVPLRMELFAPFFGPFPDSIDELFRQRKAWVDVKVADIQFVVNQLEQVNTGNGLLAGRMDLARLGLFGHSMGGDASLEFCRLDSRCKAGVNIDGTDWTEVAETGLQQPTLIMASDHFLQRCEATLGPQAAAADLERCKAEYALTASGWRKIYQTAQPGYGVAIRGSVHPGFIVDVPFLPRPPQSMIAAGLALAKVDPQRMLRLTNDYLLAFFGKHLNGIAAPLLAGPSPVHSEIVFGDPSELDQTKQP